jgi:hypothetical protein
VGSFCEVTAGVAVGFAVARGRAPALAVGWTVEARAVALAGGVGLVELGAEGGSCSVANTDGRRLVVAASADRGAGSDLTRGRRDVRRLLARRGASVDQKDQAGDAGEPDGAGGEAELARRAVRGRRTLQVVGARQLR